MEHAEPIVLEAVMAQPSSLRRRLRSWLHQSRKLERNRSDAHLAVELLEDRTTPTIITVNSLLDGLPFIDGQVTLREAIQAAVSNASAGDAPAGSPTALDTIRFDSSLAGGTIALSAGTELSLNGGGDVKIIGLPGAAARITISGLDTTRVFHVTSLASAVTIQDLTVTRGNASAVGASGGGILNEGPATNLTNVLVTRNRANADGGGIMNAGTLNVINSIISNNDAINDDGGGIANTAFLTVTRSQILSNTAPSAGGGIDTRGGSAVGTTITDSTIAGNSATFAGGLEVTGSARLFAASCTISGNFALFSGGGGIQVFGATAEI